MAEDNNLKGSVGPEQLQALRQAQQQPAPQGPKQMGGISPQDFSSIRDNGSVQPKYANGLTTENPIMRNPVSIVDRFKLVALGNKSGKLKYLKENYEDATVDKSDNILVKSSGLWHQLDPSGTGEGNPWERTKELISDAGDILPEAIDLGISGGINAAAAAIAPVTGGTSLLAAHNVNAGVAGTVAAARTSLGRLVGTYDATPEEQLKDIALETALSWAGTKYLPGVQKVGGEMIKTLYETGKTYATKVSPAVKNTVASVVASAVKSESVGNVLRWMDNPEGLRSAWQKYSKGLPEDGLKRLTRDNANNVEIIADSAQPMLSRIFGNMERRVSEEVPENFVSSVTSDAISMGNEAVKSGLGRYVRIIKSEEGKSVKTLLNQENQEEVEKFIRNHNRLPSGVKSEIKPFNMLKQERNQSGIIQEISTNEAAYKHISKMFDHISDFSDLAPATGAEGVRQMMSFKRQLGNIGFQLKEKALEDKVPSAVQAITKYTQRIDSGVKTGLDSIGKGQLYTDMNNFYNTAKNELGSVLKVAQNGKNNPGAYESFYKQLTSRSGLNERKKEGMEALIEYAGSKEAGEIGQIIKKSHDSILDNESAKIFLPWINPNMKPFLQGTSVLAAGAIASGAGIPGTAAAALAGAAVTTPRVIKAGMQAGLGAARGASKATKALVEGGFRGLDLLKRLTPEQLKILQQDEVLTKTFFGTILNAPTVQQKLEDDLVFNAVQSSDPNGGQNGR